MTNRRSRKRRGFLAYHSMCRVTLPVVVLIAATFCLQQSVEAQQRYEQVSDRKQENFPNKSSSLPENHNQQQQQQQLEIFQNKNNITYSSQANGDYVTTTVSTSPFSSPKSQLVSSTAKTNLDHTIDGQTTPRTLFISSSTAGSAETPSISTSNAVLYTTAANLATTTPTTRDNLVTTAKQRQQQPNARQQVVGGNRKQERNDGIRQSVTNTANLEPIDQMSTSQSASFAEPLMAASNQESRQRQYQTQVAQPPPSQQQQQQQQQQLRGGNRWTHFGARLKPLTTIGSDHHGADSKSLVAISLGGQNNNNNNKHNNNMQQAQLRASVGQTPNGNQVGDQDDNEDLDDDQDSEALLYKMMQQQGFLTGSIWQQNQPQPQTQQQQQQHGNGHNTLSPSDAAGDQLVQDALPNGMVGGNSKRVIKLLKSYSHIHQVDDSDDQIRGTYTRVPAHRLNGLDQNNSNNNNAWRAQPSKQQYNRNRLSSNGQQRQANHIFVSSQPLARAYSQQTGHHREVENYLGNTNQGMAYADGPGGSGGVVGQDGDANLVGGQADGDQSGQPSEEDDFECPNNGIFADEASGCQSYHVCQSGAQVQQKFQCPMGTLFNNIILTCDFAHNVQCKGKAQQEAAKAQSAASEEPPANDLPLSISRKQSQLQQEAPRAPIQVDQANNANGPQQQGRWLQAGPRQLRIGQSQYSQHQQNQQSSLAQAVSAYPHPQPASAPAAHSNNNNDSDDDSDDDPVEPLVPATLPPARINSQPAFTQGPSSSVQVVNHQSAHRSQYPSSPQQQQQAFQQHQNAMTQGHYSRANRGFNGDSISSPVFIGRDESKTTESTVNTITKLNTEFNKQKEQGDAQSFNLVINHLAPTRQQQQSSLKNVIIKQQQQQVPVAANNLETNKNGYNRELNLQSLPKQNQLVSSNQHQQNVGYTDLASNNKKLMDLRHQQRQQFASINNKLAPIDAQALQNQNQQQQQQFQRANQLRQQQYPNQNSYHQASQPKSVHVDARPVGALASATSSAAENPSLGSQQAQKFISGPGIVDLTNDKRASVSSEAINDGLLLIVRHGTSSSGSSSQQQQQQLTSYNKGPIQQQVNYKPNSQTVKHSSKLQQQHVAGGGQAFAIDPSKVRANSPIDAQLFPNVQRVLAASQPSISHRAPAHSSPAEASSSQHLQLSGAYKKQQQQYSPNRQEIRLSPPLPPMEPPKPSSYVNNNEVKDQYSNSERTSSSEAIQVLASSSQTPSTIPPQQPTVATASISSPQSTTTTIPSQPALTSQNRKVSQNKQKQKQQQQEKKDNPIKLKPKRLKAQQPPTQTQKTIAHHQEQQELQSLSTQASNNKAANIQQQ